MVAEAVRYTADVVLEVRSGEVITHHDAAIEVTNGRVSAVGRPDDLGPAPATVTHLGGMVMPGLVNVHCHAPMTLFRSAGDGLPLDRWLSEAIWPREGAMTPDDVHAGMLLGSTEMLLAGVTTSMEMYLHDEAIVEAVRTTGARLVSTPGILRVIHGADLSGRLDYIRELHQRHHDPEQRISIGFGPHSVYELDEDLLRTITAAAADLDAVFHIHLEETQEERARVLERDGRSATQVLDDVGALERTFVGAHGVWLDADDRRLLGQAGANIAHCPNSNLKLGSGFADVRAMLDNGINVAVATDGPASADSLDLWRGIGLAAGIARAVRLDPGALGASDVLLMATASGGRAIGQPDVGTLTIGSRADFCRIDLDQPVFEPSLDDHELLTHLAFTNHGGYVSDVWVDGEPVVVDHAPVNVDLDAVMADVSRRARTGAN